VVGYDFDSAVGVDSDSIFYSSSQLDFGFDFDLSLFSIMVRVVGNLQWHDIVLHDIHMRPTP